MAHCAAVSCLAPACGTQGSYTPPGECCPVCGSQGPGSVTPVTDFTSCVAAGNPVMESWPEQCRDPLSGQTFVNTDRLRDGAGPPTRQGTCQPNTAVRGVNDRVLEQRLSRKQCIRACKRESAFACRSVEHHPETKQCVLSSADRSMPTIPSSQGWSLCYVEATGTGQGTGRQYVAGSGLPFRGQRDFGNVRYPGIGAGGFDGSGRFGLRSGRGMPQIPAFPGLGSGVSGGSKWCVFQGQRVPPGLIASDPLCTCDGSVGQVMCS